MEGSKMGSKTQETVSSTEQSGSMSESQRILEFETLQRSLSSTHSSGGTAVDSEIDKDELINNLVGVLEALGLDSDSEHFIETPERVAEMFISFRQGTEETLGEILKVGFEETDDNILVVQTDIPFKGLCAHHLLPFFGTAAVGYIPRKRVVGLSKLTRLVQAAGTIAPSTQEHITNLIADSLYKTMECMAAGAITTALHGCMAVRGVNAPTTKTRVQALRGQFLMNPMARQEFLDAVRG